MVPAWQGPRFYELMKRSELEAFIASQTTRLYLERVKELRAAGQNLQEAKEIAESEGMRVHPGERPEAPFSMSPEDKDGLIAAIRAVFDGVRRGSGTSLHEAEAFDDWKPADVAIRARALDTEQDWQDIADSAIEKFHYALSYMDAEGYRFHLPRFMIWALEHPDYKGPTIARDAATYSLNCHDERLRDHIREKWLLLSDEQRRIIARFLTFIVTSGLRYDRYSAARALLEDWNEYSPDGD